MYDGLLAVVVGIDEDKNIPEDHVALWFGEPQVERKSKGGTGNNKPKVYCELVHEIDFVH